MENVVVLDYGSDTFRAGRADTFPSDYEPRLVLSSAVRRSHAADGTAIAAPAADGDDVLRVVQGGVVAHWDGLEALMQHALYGACGWLRGVEGGLVVSESMFARRAEREQLTQLAFEVFNVSGLFVASQAVLSLYAVNRTTGCAIDIGHETTAVGAVVDGLLCTSTVQRAAFAGSALTQLTQHLLSLRGIDVSRLHARELKESLAHVCASKDEFKTQIAAAKQGGQGEVHTLPDGRTFTVGCEPAYVGEALFDPSVISSDDIGIVQRAFDAVAHYGDAAQRKAMLDGVFVCGGTACMPGINTRFESEFRTMLPLSSACSVVSVPDYMPPRTTRHSSWMGGAILAKVVAQQNQYVSKRDYEDTGPSVANWKCS